MNDFLAPFETLLGGVFPPGRVRAIDGGGKWTNERREIEASGFLDALAPEAAGGSALSLAEIVPLWRAIGGHAAPIEIGQAMIDRAEKCARQAALARALLLSAASSGAADRVLAMTVEYANQRAQFGKPIGRQQAVQQQIAVMAEQVVAMRLAVDLAGTCQGGLTVASAAVAKTVTALYAPAIANAAHAVHGAIGISAEHDLQLYTRRLHEWRLDNGSETLWARRLGRELIRSADDTLGWMRAELFS